MELFIQLIVGISWPLSIFAIVLIIRKDLAKVIGRLTKLRYKDLEAEFNETLHQIEITETKQHLQREPDDQEGWNPLRERKKELYSLAALSPRAAILESWIDLEAQVCRSAKYLKVESKRDVLTTLNALSQKSQRVPKSYIEAVQGLRKLRNVATHEADLSLSEEDAVEYVSRAIDVAASIDSLTNPEFQNRFRENI